MKKPLVPGVSDTDVAAEKLRDERIFAARTAALEYNGEITRRRKDAEERRTELYNLAPMMKINASAISAWLKTFIITNMFALGVGSANWAVNNRSGNMDTNSFIARTDYKTAIKNAYTGSAIDEYGRDAALHTMTTVLFMVFAIWLSCGAFSKKRNRQLHFSRDVIDAMHTTLRNGDKMPPVLRMRLNKLAQCIIANMSANNRVYFDSIVNGWIKKPNLEFVDTVVTAHLNKHPDDFAILETSFDVESIPMAWIDKYHNTKQK